MAILSLTPLSEVAGYRRRPTDDHAKLRELYYKIVNDAVAGDDGTYVKIGTLPPGHVRIFPNLCKMRFSAFGASRVLKTGYRAFQATPGTDTAEDDDAFSSGIDISSAGTSVLFMGAATVMKYDLYSLGGIELFQTVTGGTFPAAAELEGYIVYGYE